MKNANSDIINYDLYRRKSTDDDRQVLSLDSQRTEAIKRFPNLKFKVLPDESVSAFKPYKRPVFNEMIERIKSGKTQGIVAWHPDRLSRNPIDAAQIIYLLDTGLLKDLKFSSYHFDNSPEGKMMLQITMSQSKYSSDKLSKDVKRGINKKADMGWRPCHAPLGYKNSKIKLKGEQDIYNDPDRFDLVKQLLNVFLQGNYTIAQIADYANSFLHLTLPATRKRPERRIHNSEMYRILINPFYYGLYEWPTGSGNWMQGKHEPMITQAEYDRIQYILGRKGKPRPQKHKFAFTGLVRCGSCEAMVTAEEKFKRQKNGNIHHYIYYHCTKRINPDCTEKSIELKQLNKQIDDILASIQISEKFKNWAIEYLYEIRKQEAKAQESCLSAKHRRLEYVVKTLDNITLQYVSPENSDFSIMSSEELKSVKAPLLKEKAALEHELQAQGQEIEQWLEMSEKTFNFAYHARAWFENGDADTKRAIFACLGSDLMLKDQKITLNLQKPFQIIFDGLPKAVRDLEKLEPLNQPVDKRQLETFAMKFPLLSG